MATINKDKFHQFLYTGLTDAKKGAERTATEVFADLEEILNTKGEKCTNLNQQN